MLSCKEFFNKCNCQCMALCRKNGTCEYFCYTLIFLAILHLQTLPYQNLVVAIFFPTHLWRPFRISKWPLFSEYYRIVYQLMQANYDFIPQILMFFDFKCKAIKCHNFLLPNMANFSVFKMAANVISEILLFFNSSFAIIF